jgi:hypothetical protein
VTIVLGIAMVWLLAGVAWFAIFSLLVRRPLTETDHQCARIDRALSRQSLDSGRGRAHRGDGLVGLRAV